ncbi:hypothetical protein BGZ76_004292 [Entomortierella beljakovae]|nr:hypothetical protein BGZ76_004292 [Entomortierella beljakovae]
MSELSIPQVWGGKMFHPLLLEEILMITASNIIREKPEWWIKYKDPIISSKWKKELLEIGSGSLYTNRHPLNEEQIEYIFKELDWHAERRQKQVDLGVTAPIEDAIDGVRRCDGMIPLELKERLLACVKKLKDIPEEELDWHPGSVNQVLDLVHPSLYPVVVGLTRVTKEEAIPPLEFIGLGDIVKETKDPNSHDSIYSSRRFQWLPTDVIITEDGKASFKSYINNLHPEEHKDMYPVLEEILERFIPMFEDVISDMRNINERKDRLIAVPDDWYGEEPIFDNDDDYDEYNENVILIPCRSTVPEFEPRKDPELYNLIDRGKLQVIVKLADIILTPDNPKYPGGTWHVEGMENENIAASGIYYYCSDNISESRLNFRIGVHNPPYKVDDSDGSDYMYGIPDEGHLSQYRGGVITKEDRCIAFPNIYQHQVQPFELADPTKPGLRSIVVFFLVNPEKPILSTTNVPPQQMSWHKPAGLRLRVAEKLPPEIAQMIDEFVDFPVSLGMAKDIRENLMRERKFVMNQTNRIIMERPFSLCEH